MKKIFFLALASAFCCFNSVYSDVEIELTEQLQKIQTEVEAFANNAGKQKQQYRQHILMAILNKLERKIERKIKHTEQRLEKFLSWVEARNGENNSRNIPSDDSEPQSIDYDSSEPESDSESFDSYSDSDSSEDHAAWIQRRIQFFEKKIEILNNLLEIVQTVKARLNS
jgi:hypothetical protein